MEKETPPPDYGATDVEAAEPQGTDSVPIHLPTYTETTNAAPPPSYDSLYGRIQEARSSSDSNVTFVKKFCEIILNTIGFLVLIAVFLAIPIAMIVIGAVNLDNCPLQRFIPIWLIVAGASGAVMQLGNLFDRSKAKYQGRTPQEIEEESSSLRKSFNGCLGCFNFAWFIAGNVWVYAQYKPVTNPVLAPGEYCDNLTYYFAFWIITCTYILMAVMCCCTSCIAMCVGKKD